MQCSYTGILHQDSRPATAEVFLVLPSVQEWFPVCHDCEAYHKSKGRISRGLAGKSVTPASQPGLHRCQRCGGEEHIPTHQQVKFDLKERFLCTNCWEGFRRWFFGRKED